MVKLIRDFSNNEGTSRLAAPLSPGLHRCGRQQQQKHDQDSVARVLAVGLHQRLPGHCWLRVQLMELDNVQLRIVQPIQLKRRTRPVRHSDPLAVGPM